MGVWGAPLPCPKLRRWPPVSYVDLDGIPTWYETVGSGPPILMLSPGGFNAKLDNWHSFGRYKDLQMVRHLSDTNTCVLFDRREAGRSGGRLERLSWDAYAAQGAALLDHLGIGRAAVMGGCAGCSVAVAMAVSRPAVVASMILFSPAGGAKYRLAQHARMAAHLAFAASEGLEAVVGLAGQTGGSFSAEPRVGPWGPLLASDPAFASVYSASDLERYKTVVAGTARLMFDRDTVPGAEPEDLLGLDIPALVIPGDDDSHATSGARYLAECLPVCQYWNVEVGDQSEQRVADRLAGFLADTDWR